MDGGPMDGRPLMANRRKRYRRTERILIVPDWIPGAECSLAKYIAGYGLERVTSNACIWMSDPMMHFQMACPSSTGRELVQMMPRYSGALGRLLHLGLAESVYCFPQWQRLLSRPIGCAILACVFLHRPASPDLRPCLA